MFGNVTYYGFKGRVGHKQGRFVTSTEGFIRLEDGEGIDLHDMLTGHKHSIRIMPIHTNIMRASGLLHGGFVLVDTTAKPVKGNIVAVQYNGATVIRRLEKSLTRWALVADDPREQKLLLTEFSEYKLLGVITFAINDCRMLEERIGKP